ncbi:glutathione peroxidase [Paenibacillus provencensis]|uniref:Glutathione peroxidase n=1 Tax=Paenibacillus provencensis TaxID=441151 RepID=A0ABW3PU22_9BACL|nr:glutathione peroxidase [Paenibacillus sp. MER 78]MCM3127639.1 glutathione peroxidase [Paenibacillus sp. MER 78]
MSIYQYQVNTLKGQKLSMEEYKGKVLLIVNTASKCGLTPQYKGLQELYDKFNDQSFEILGFPSNQFAEQEPGSNEEIAEFCQMNYGVSFPMFEKIKVNGDEAHPLFKHLKNNAPGILGSKTIKWNFTKFLIDQNGNIVKRYSPQTTPDKIGADIAKLLK